MTSCTAWSLYSDVNVRRIRVLVMDGLLGGVYTLNSVSAKRGEVHTVIHDCGGDAAVKSRMMEEYPSLVKAGYSNIVCIRDVYPTFTQRKFLL